MSVKKAVVYITEYKYGWGHHVIERKTFDTEEQAKKFIKDYNKNKNMLEPKHRILAEWAGFREEPE